MSLTENVRVSNDELAEFQKHIAPSIWGYNVVHDSGRGWYLFPIAPLRVGFKVQLVLDLLKHFCTVANDTVVFFLTTVNLADIIHLH